MLLRRAIALSLALATILLAAPRGPAEVPEDLPPPPLVALRQELREARDLALESEPPAPVDEVRALETAARLVKPRRVELSWELGALRRGYRVLSRNLDPDHPALKEARRTLDSLEQEVDAEFFLLEDCIARPGQHPTDDTWDRLDRIYEKYDRSFDAETTGRRVAALRRVVRSLERFRERIDTDDSCVVRMDGFYEGDGGVRVFGDPCTDWQGGFLTVRLRQTGTLVTGTGSFEEYERFDGECEWTGYGRVRFHLNARLRAGMLVGVLYLDGRELPFEGTTYDFGREWEIVWNGETPGDLFAWRW